MRIIYSPTLLFFPNPASEYITLLLEESTISSITITDLKGSTIASEENINTSQKNVSVNAMRPGLYLIKVIDTNGYTTVKKLVIR